MCPYYLDGDLRATYAALGDTRFIGYCVVFKVRRGRNRGDSTAGLSKLSSASKRERLLQVRSTFRDAVWP